MNFVLIDGSYFIFYRFYALINWWKLSKQEDDIEFIVKNKEFIDKFIKTFSDKLNEINKKLNIKHSIKIVGKDCRRKDIWRNKFIENYKGNRNDTKNSYCKDFFKLVYNENLFENNNIKYILEYPELEADDCIAITTKHILENYKDATIWIITNDMDYLQLSHKRVNIFNLQYTKITDKKTSTNNPECDKFCKIVCGDKSDNIKGIFKKCGLKTAIKLYENPQLFKDKMKDETIYNNYLLNKKLIDFDEIPKLLVDGFKNNVLCIS
jgi:5'-3' exonuclease